MGNLGSNLFALMLIMLKGYQVLAFREPFWSLFAEIFLTEEKFPRPWKNPLIVQNFLDCGKIPWLCKISLIMENFLDSRKLTFLIAKSRSNNFEAYKTCILNVEKKLSLLVLFTVDKINIIFSRRLKEKC